MITDAPNPAVGIRSCIRQRLHQLLSRIHPRRSAGNGLESGGIGHEVDVVIVEAREHGRAPSIESLFSRPAGQVSDGRDPSVFDAQIGNARRVDFRVGDQHGEPGFRWVM